WACASWTRCCGCAAPAPDRLITRRAGNWREVTTKSVLRRHEFGDSLDREGGGTSDPTLGGESASAPARTATGGADLGQYHRRSWTRLAFATFRSSPTSITASRHLPIGSSS